MSWNLSNLRKAIGDPDELGLYLFLSVVGGPSLAVALYLTALGLSVGWAVAAGIGTCLALVGCFGFAMVRVVFVILRGVVLAGLVGLILGGAGEMWLGKRGFWPGLVLGVGLVGALYAAQSRKAARAEREEQTQDSGSL